MVRFARASFVLLFCVACWPLRADILVNGNFADGRAHWRGDAEDVDAVNMGGMSSQSPGIVIKLKPDKWTKIYQNFNNRTPKLYFKVTCKLSDDYKLKSHDPQDTSAPDFGDIPTDWTSYPMEENAWHIFVSGTGFFLTTKNLQPDASRTTAQSFSGKITGLAGVDEAVFVMFFPPGTGTITLLNVNLSATDPNGDPAN